MSVELAQGVLPPSDDAQPTAGKSKKRQNSHGRPAVQSLDSDVRADHTSGTTTSSGCCDVAAVSPDSQLLHAWEVVAFVFALYLVVTTSFRIAFEWSTEPMGFYFYFDFAVDLFFIVDVLLQFRIGYYVSGVKVMDVSMIRERYLHGWFAYDLIAFLPLDLIQLYIGAVMPIFRLNKIIRIVRIIASTANLESVTSINVTLGRLAKIVLYSFLMLHFVACTWFLYGYTVGLGHSAWGPEHDLHGVTSSYLHSMFFAMTSIGGVGEIRMPSSIFEFLFSAICELVGLFAFAYVIGNFDSIIALLSDHQKEYASRINFVSQFMMQHSVSPVTQAKVNSYYNYLWAANDGKDISDTMALLPDSLRSEVSMFLLQSLVERVSFFKKAEPGFISSVIAMLEPFIAVPGQFIMRAGDVGTAMYFLQKGEAEVLVGPSELKVSKLESGDYFGEMAVLFLAPRSASIRAVTYCELFQLSKTNLEHVMNMYPEQAQFIMEEAALKKKLTVLRSTTIKKQGTQDVATPTMRRQRTSANSANDIQAAATLVNINSLMRAPTSSMAQMSLSAEGSDSDSEDFLPPPRKPAQSSPSPSPLPPSSEPVQEAIAADVPGTVDTADADSDVGSESMSDVDVMSAEEMAGADELHSGDRQSSNGRRMSVISMTSSVEEIDGANFSDAVFVEGITKWLKYWRWTIRFVILYNFFFVPLRCGFFPFDASPAILVLDYFGDALLLVDIYVLLRTAAHERGTWITDIDQLWSHHFHSPWFILDVLGSIPALDFVMLHIGMNATLRLPRLLRIFSFFRPDHTRVSTSEHLRRMFEMIATLLLTIHLVACAYYAFTIFEGFSPVLPEGAESLWLPDASFQFASVTLQYFRAFFFAISHLTAYGRIIYPNSDAQCAFAIVVMIFGKFFTAYLVGAVAGIMTQLGVQKTRFGSMMHQIGEFSEQYALPTELRSRINHYFEHSWNLQQGIDPNQALRYLPVELRSVITLQLVGNMLRSLPMFAACRDTFIKVLAGELAFDAYPAGEFIFYKGEVGSKMYFVVHGRVGLILNPEQSLEPFKVIGRGSFFGEAALFLGKRGASARANTSLQVLTLSNAALKRVITMFPEFEEMIKKVVTSRAQFMAQKEEIARSESKKATSSQNTTANEHDANQSASSTVPLDSTERQATVRFDADVPKPNDISP